MSASTFYVSTPIYYVNDRPHIGHAYTTILADVLARYHRLIGVPTFFLTGTDEHGQKVQQAAEKREIEPKQHVDETVVRFQELWQYLDITHDDFIRTTEPRHAEVVQEILQDLYDRGDIYRADYDGWYCVTCERFYTDKDVVDETCPEEGCGRPVTRITESNYFFRMSAYQEWLIAYIEENPTFIQPDFRRNETLGFLRKPLNDLCISRPKSRLNWGIELPFDKDFVTYVWFDALVNYISAIGYRRDDAMFDRWWPVSVHLIGKDILTTHTVYWPTMLKAMGLPMPRMVFAHGWWLVGRDKMSKSAGNVIDPMAMAEAYGIDAFRYFLMAEMTLGQDSSFTEPAFIRRYNTDLANDLGNTLSRVTKMIQAHCEGCIPPCGDLDEASAALRDTAVAAAEAMVAAVENMRLDAGLSELAGAIRAANRYLEAKQPWSLGKDPERRDELHTVLYVAADVLRIVSGMLYPVMPGKMAQLRAALGCADGEPAFKQLKTWGALVPGTSLGAPVNLFPRIKLTASTESESTPPKPRQSRKKKRRHGTHIEYSDFETVQLKTAEVLAAEPVDGTDKLLKLQVRVGDEERQIVAGVAAHYEPADIVGKTVIIVANLKPVKIRGVESQGMLLAAGDGDVLSLVTTDRPVPGGSSVS